MPLDEKILGLSNRWYRAAMESSVTERLSDDLEIRIVKGPFFIATKFEAFKGRGKGDYFGSHDLEDLISVVDGRPALVTDVQAGATGIFAPRRNQPIPNRHRYSALGEPCLALA